MNTIAICDDNQTDIKKIISMVQKWNTDKKEVQFVIKYFDSPQKLLSEVEKGATFDLFLLDIIMPEMTGIALGERLRQLVVDPLLIFLTSSEDYYPDAFRLYAFQYLCKPVIEQDLFVALDKAFVHCEKTKNNLFLLKTKTGLTKIPYHHITYVELRSHICHFYLKDGQHFESLYLRTAFENFLEPLLQHEQFVKTHISFIVNMNYIVNLSVGKALLTISKTIPVARSYAKEVQQRYVSYRLKGDRLFL